MKHYLLRNSTAQKSSVIIDGSGFQSLDDSPAVRNLGQDKKLIALSSPKEIGWSHAEVSDTKLKATFQGSVVVIVNGQVIPFIFDTTNIDLHFNNSTDKPFKLKRLVNTETPGDVFQSFEFEEFNFETTSIRFVMVGATSKFQAGIFEPLNEEKTEFGISILKTVRETSYFDPVSGERKSQLVSGTLTRESLDPDLTYDEDGMPTDAVAYAARVAGRKDLVVGAAVDTIATRMFTEWKDLGTVELNSFRSGEETFAGLNLTSIVIGPNTRYIDREAFFVVDNIDVSLSFNNSQLKEIGVRAFMGLSEQSAVATIGLAFPNTLMKIHTEAFQNAHIKVATFGNSPDLEIGSNAFFNSTLESVTFVNGKILEAGAFGECLSLSDINFGEGITTMTGRVFSNSPVKNVHIPTGTHYVDGGVFANCGNIETFTIAEGLLRVGSTTDSNGFFSGTSSPIKEIAYPNSVLDFYGDDFSPFGQLEYIYLGSGIRHLSSFGFNGGTVRGIYIVAPWNINMTYPSPAAPWCDVYANDLAGIAANVDHSMLTNLAWSPIPVVASIPVLPDLVPVENSIADWSVQYRDLLTGEVKQLALGTEINVGDIPADALIDEVLVNGTVVTIKPNALAHRSIKRMKLMEGVKNVGGILGAEYMKDLYIADTVNRIGGSIAVAASLEKFHMPTTGFLAIDVTQFQTWNPALGFDLPTVSVSLPVAKDVVMTMNEVVGNVEQEGLSVMIKHGVVTWGPVISGANGDFVYTSATNEFVDGYDYVIEATDVVGNESEYTFTYHN